MTRADAEALAKDMVEFTGEPYYVCRRMGAEGYATLPKASYLLCRGLSVYNADSMVEPWSHMMRVL